MPYYILINRKGQIIDFGSSARPSNPNLLLYRRIGLERYRGVLLGNTLVLVFVARFLIEFIKERQVPFEDQMNLDVGQVLSIPFILLGIFLLLRGMKGGKNMTQRFR